MYHESRIDKVSSDIHTFHHNSDDNELSISRYEILIPIHTHSANIERDEDSITDKCVRKRRKRSRSSCFLTMYHLRNTPIWDVGKQLWRGALLLADYIIYQREQLCHRIVFELGAGIGLLGKVASLLPCRSVYVTDVNQSVVDLMIKNMNTNSHVLPFHNNATIAQTHPRVLNWCNEKSCRDRLDPADKWTPQDTSELNNHNVLWLAADVIYDDQLTDAFFATLTRFMNPGEHLWLALEKRFNFTVEEMSLVAHGYRRFLSYIGENISASSVAPLESDIDERTDKDNTSHTPQCGSMTSVDESSNNESSPTVSFKGHRIPMNFPQYVLDYDRVKDLELWDIVLLNK